MATRTYTPCPFCAKSVYVLFQTCPHCGRRARTGTPAVAKGSIEAHDLALWRSDPTRQPPECFYPPINPTTGERSPAYRTNRTEVEGEAPDVTTYDDLVTLEQAAQMAHRSKRTLENYKGKGLPGPKI